MGQAFALPPLRQELRLEPGAPLPSGAPGFVLFDPLRHLFFEIGAIEQRIIAHWRCGEAEAVRDALIAEGESQRDAEDAIVAFHEFALSNSLTRDAPGNAVKTLADRHARAKRDWWRWLLDHYLFVRIPLARPTDFLRRTLPVARRIWSPAGIAALATMALIGLFLVTRQWDAFTASFAGLLNAQGLVAYGCALLFVKAFHELGHAYTATRFGCPVPTMGVSFLVMVPVFYTDTTAAWRLRTRRQRMTIDAAGLMAEFSIAAIALFLWSFLPDGPVRTGAFVLATTSLATSLLINASPFMRYDGYYILSDFLGVPNLASRAFALARWRLRELLFALGEPPPEMLGVRLRRTMLAYAVATIVYRAALYIGIALFVYHSVFKALGIILFAVEVFVFLVRPILSEAREWRARLPQIKASGRARATALIAGVALLCLFLPLDRSVTTPAILMPIVDKPLVTGEPARVDRILVANGDSVAAGQPLLILSSPDLDLGVLQSATRIAQLESQIARGVADREDLADTTVLQRDLLAERDRLAGFERRRFMLTVRAGVAGRVVDLQRDLKPGNWTDGRAALVRVVTPGRYSVRAYMPEDESWRVASGSMGTFTPSSGVAGSWAVRLDEIGASAIPTLDQPALASVNGGPIATQAAASKDALKPAGATVALNLVAERSQDDRAFVQPMTGAVTLPARGESIAARVTRSIMRVLVRESSLS